jgi:hypothetical protein
MAYPPNSTNLPRRCVLVAFFAGIAASIAGRAGDRSLASTPGCLDADAQLLDRWREYVGLEITLNAAQDARDRVSWTAGRLIQGSQIVSPAAG